MKKIFAMLLVASSLFFFQGCNFASIKKFKLDIEVIDEKKEPVSNAEIRITELQARFLRMPSPGFIFESVSDRDGKVSFAVRTNDTLDIWLVSEKCKWKGNVRTVYYNEMPETGRYSITFVLLDDICEEEQ